MFQTMRTAFPDLEVAPEHMTATEDEVALAYNIPGTTLEGQHRYAEDVRLCLEAYFNSEPMEQDHLIVQDGEIVSGSYHAVYGQPRKS